MERKISEIFEHKGEWYQCVEGTGCYKCDFYFNGNTCTAKNPHCACRSDWKNVVYKKLEKVGEPYDRFLASNKSVKVQRYRLPYRYAILPKEPIMILEPNYKNSIEIEIKQKKEDMEENNTKHSNSENIGKKLRKFDIEAAKAGKPVCTRGGRKARIICFDRDNANNKCNIVALIERDGEEIVRLYDEFGNQGGNEYDRDDYDLMMLPEKHEGWVNVYKDDRPYTESDNIYSSKESAVEASKTINKKNYVATVKICWEE